MEINTNREGNMTANDFTYDVTDDTAAADFFVLMERAGVGAERIAAMKATREAFLVVAKRAA